MGCVGNDPCKSGKMLFSIASANVGYCGVQPKRRNFALLTRLLLSPRLRGCSDFPDRRKPGDLAFGQANGSIRFAESADRQPRCKFVQRLCFLIQ